MTSRFRDLLTYPDRVRYIYWRLTGARGTFRCQFRHGGPRISIRPEPSDDYTTAYEIFRWGVYDTDLPSDSVKRVVDLGGNVGYSCLHWCWRYPNTRVVTFEPNPKHCEILSWHLNVNNYARRVDLIPAGAASRDGAATFIDDDIRSRVVLDKTAKPQNSIDIKLVDMFSAIGSEPVDIFKMDIEGGEYEIMQDPRFEAMARGCKVIIMEWHQRERHHLGGGWCAAKLRDLGFDVEEKFADKNIGLLLAQRPEAQAQRPD